MQQYKIIHTLSQPEFERLVAIIEDHESMQWLSSGRDGEGWSRARLEKLREWSARDDSSEATNRAYYFWAILVDGRVAGMIGIHPMPRLHIGARSRASSPRTQSGATSSMARKGSDASRSRCRAQIMFVVAREYRGHGIAAQATRDILARYPRTCVLIHPDNVAAIRAMSKVRQLARVAQPVHVRDRESAYVLFEPTN